MNTLDTRTLQDGSQTVVTIFEDTKEYVIEAVNRAGIASMRLTDVKEAWHAFLHPFDRESRLNYPGLVAEKRATQRELTTEEYALLEALNEVNSDEMEVA